MNFKKPKLRHSLFFLLLAIATPLVAEEFDFNVERRWQQEHAFNSEALQGSKLVVDIIIGGIEVLVHEGPEIEISIDSHWRGRTEEDLEQAEEELEMLVEETRYGVLVYLDTPYRDRGQRYQNRSRDYRFEHNVTVRLPAHFALDLNTVTGGDIRVVASNGAMQLNTVTGDIILNEPSVSVAAETVSGDIRLYFQNQPNVDIALKSSYGKLFSDFSYDDIPGSGELLIEKVGNLTSYRKNPYAGIRIGSGAGKLQLESLSGDIAIQKFNQGN